METTFNLTLVVDQDEHEQKLAADAARELKIAEAGQKLLARIRQSSKYFGQTVEGQLFPVYITSSGAMMHGVVGGPGGQYRLRDVDIFVVFNEKPVQITFEK